MCSGELCFHSCTSKNVIFLILRTKSCHKVSLEILLATIVLNESKESIHLLDQRDLKGVTQHSKKSCSKATRECFPPPCVQFDKVSLTVIPSALVRQLLYAKQCTGLPRIFFFSWNLYWMKPVKEKKYKMPSTDLSLRKN